MKCFVVAATATALSIVMERTKKGKKMEYLFAGQSKGECKQQDDEWPPSAPPPHVEVVMCRAEEEA